MHPEDVASGKASSVLQSEQVHADFHGGLHDLFGSSSELIDQMEHTDGKHSLSVEVEEKFGKYFGYLARCEISENFLYIDSKIRNLVAKMKNFKEKWDKCSAKFWHFDFSKISI